MSREASQILQNEHKQIQDDLYNIDKGGDEWLRCKIDFHEGICETDNRDQCDRKENRYTHEIEVSAMRKVRRKSNAPEILEKNTIML